jgi:tetrahydromethanopterin S-methyltransferase subunit F
MHRVPEGPLKDMMRGTAYKTAEEYFQIAQQSFIPLLLKGDHAEARKVAIERMKPVYEEHATAVDQIVDVANREARDGEALAARNVRLYTGVMVAVGLGVLLVGGLFSFSIARAFLSKPQNCKVPLNNCAHLLGVCRAFERKRGKELPVKSTINWARL